MRYFYGMIKGKYFPFYILFAITFQSCEKQNTFSTFAINFSDENQNVNQTNIEKILYSEFDSITRVAITADSHRFYDELFEFVRDVNNQEDIDFVIHAGDFTDFGLPFQYEWYNSIMKDLDLPYISIAGNHDLISNGKESYKMMFGELNFSFIFNRLKFIYINTNSREYEFDGTVPNIYWLNMKLVPDSSFDKAIVVFHIQPGDGEGDFDNSKKDAFLDVLEKYNNVALCIHGHNHGFEYHIYENTNIPFLNVYGTENKKYNVIELTKDTLKVITNDL